METEPEISPLAELRRLVIEQKKINLPPEPEDPALTALHDAVEAYDQQVSRVVIAAMQGLPANAQPETIQAARQQAGEQLESALAQSNRRAGFYQSYLTRLDTMLKLAHEIIASQPDINERHTDD